MTTRTTKAERERRRRNHWRRMRYWVERHLLVESGAVGFAEMVWSRTTRFGGKPFLVVARNGEAYEED